MTLGRVPSNIDLCVAAENLDVKRLTGRTVNSLIARKCPPPCCHDKQGPLEPATPLALVAVSGLRRGLVMEPPLPATAPPTQDPALDTNGSTMPASACGVQRRWPETDPDQPSASKALGSDPSLVVPVFASPAEVFRARELREQLKKKYLNRPSQPCSLWWVGAD